MHKNKHEVGEGTTSESSSRDHERGVASMEEI